jgi:hypothetical protein
MFLIVDVFELRLLHSVTDFQDSLYITIKTLVDFCIFKTDFYIILA